MEETPKQPWWKEAVGYQIYPASFKDSNRDGVGDLNGITESLDYLKALGVDFIWLSPVYDSPDHDMGYDIRNYEAIASRYGSMDDMDHLIKEAKVRDMRVLMDLVVNHTSIEHAWFEESRQSKTNSKSDWYLWRDGKVDPDGNRKPPSNWKSHFGGSSWQYEPLRDQYFFHLFLAEQADLNWNNEDVRKAVYESAIKFWLDRGIDGFRVDMVNAYWKHPDFPDVDVIDESQEHQPLNLSYILNGPKVHEWLQEMRQNIVHHYGRDIVIIGELPGTSQDEVLKYLAPDRKELDMTIDGMFVIAGNNWWSELHDMRKHTLPELKEAFELTQGLLSKPGAWTTAFLENHDVPRSVSHLGPGEGPYLSMGAKALALLNTTLSGTLIVYQGQEIGMTNVNKDTWKPEDFKDTAHTRYVRDIEARFPGIQKMREASFMAGINRGRDNARTPMQWSNMSPNAGFTAADAVPWLRVNPNFETINVNLQLHDKKSVLTFWKAAVALRKQYGDVFVHGDLRIIDRHHKQTFCFWKISSRRKALILLNLSSTQAHFDLEEEERRIPLKLLISTNADRKSEDPLDILEPWEGRVYLEI